MNQSIGASMDRCYLRYAAGISDDAAGAIQHKLRRIYNKIPKYGGLAGDVLSRRADLLGADLGTQRLEHEQAADEQILLQYSVLLEWRGWLWVILHCSC